MYFNVRPPRRRFPQDLRRKLIYISSVLIISTFIIQGYVYHDRFETRRTEELQSNLELARSVAKTFEIFIKDTLHQQLAIGLALSSKELSPSERIEILNANKVENRSIWELFWVNTEGSVTAATGDHFIGMDISDRHYFKQIVAGQEWVISDLLLSRTTKQPSFTLSRGIRNGRGELLGVLVAGILPERLDAILGIERSKDASVSIYDSRAMHAYRYPRAGFTWEERNWLTRYPLITEAVHSKEISTTVVSPFDGENRLISFSPIPICGWIASASRSERTTMKEIHSSLLPQAGAYSFITFAVLFVLLGFWRKTSTSITELRDHALALGRGDKPIPLGVSGTTEIDDLSSVFTKMAEDIQSRESELKQAERLALERLSEIDDLYRNAPVGLCVLDRDLRWVRVNERLAEINGIPADAHIGKRMRELMPQLADEVEPEMLRVLETGKPRLNIEIVGETPAQPGIKRSWLEQWLPLVDANGHINGLSIVVEETTERKQAEERLHKLNAELNSRVRELQEFSFAAAHDLSEPLRKIQTLGSLLEGKSADLLDHQSRDYISRMIGAASRMRELLDALLRYACVDMKGHEFGPVKLDDVLRDAAKDLEVSIQKIEACVEISQLPTVTGDPYQLRQLFLNLIANAVKYNRSGVKTVIKVYAESSNGTSSIFVEDNGIGFDQQYLDKIFQPFQRLHGRSEYSGIGMGLAICRKIVERHHGMITAKSMPGKGSTFIVILPS